MIENATSKTLPDFLVIGAAKAGTSALYHYLSQHPQIFMPAKEVRFFAFDDGPEAKERISKFGSDHFPVRDLAAYQTLFARADPALVWGEVAPIYLESVSAAGRIRALIPEVRLIACLRNPANRAYSGYLMQVRQGREHRDPMKAFDVDAHHVQASFYYAQVKRYLDLFPREQVLLLLYEDFARNNEEVLGRIFEFLDLGRATVPLRPQGYNVSAYPRSRFLNSVIENRVTRELLRPRMPRWARHLARHAKLSNFGKAPAIPSELYARLVEIYRSDIERLQDLTLLDLSGWTRLPD